MKITIEQMMNGEYLCLLHTAHEAFYLVPEKQLKGQVACCEDAIRPCENHAECQYTMKEVQEAAHGVPA